MATEEAASGDVERSSLPRSRPNSSRGTGDSREQGKSERKEDEDSEEKDMEEERANMLRRRIRNRESIRDDIFNLIEDIDEDEEKLNAAGAILNAKDLEEGKNLLLYAAAYGRVELFSCLKMSLEKKRNKSLLPVLVKGLRASDDDGAPLLFHAAKSGNICCLKYVEKFILETIGKDELAEQLLTQDHISSTIVMYAAKSRKLEVLTYIKSRLDEKVSEGYSNDCLARDDKDRSLLHIAARSGEVKILEKVVGFYSDKARLRSDFSYPDKGGRTPFMHLLRNKSNAGLDNLKEMYDILDKAGGGSGAALKQLTHTWKTSADQEAPTGLMHAAHGGMNSLQLVFNVFLQKETRGGEQSLNLDKVLMGSRTSNETELLHKRLGILLAEAASGGSVKVLQRIVSAIQSNKLETGTDSEPTIQQGGRLQPAMEAIGSYYDKDRPAQNIFKYAISSGDPRAVKYIKKCVNKIFLDKDKVWELLSGTDEGINCLTYAASVENDQSVSNGESESKFESQEESGLGHVEAKSSEDSQGEEQRVKNNHAVFGEVLTAVDEAATKFGDEKRVELLESLFVASGKEEHPRRYKGRISTLKRNSRGHGGQDWSVNRLMPLAGAVFRSNERMVIRVYEAYQQLSRENLEHQDKGLNGWDVQKIMNQIPDAWTNPKKKDRVLYEMASSGGVPNVAPSMLGTIVKVLGWAHEDFFETQDFSTRTLKEGRLKEKRSMRAWMERLIQVAAERGAFNAIRDLTRKDFFPFGLVMPPLLERIGDNEENTIEIVMNAISRARNPFYLGAVALRFIRMAHIEYPMHEHSLNRLQGRIDRLMIEILRKLPKTLRSMGLEFGAHKSRFLSKPFPNEEWERLREADKLGFAVVQWMLEPSTVQDMVKDNRKQNNAEDSTTFQEQEPHRIDDPLQSALDRGSDALSFTNSPLVRDYMHSKFSKSLPSWASRGPFHHNIHVKFFKYGAEDKADVDGQKDPKIEEPMQDGEHAPDETAPAAQNVAQLGTSRETFESLQINDARNVETTPATEGAKASEGMTGTDGIAKADNTTDVEGSLQANHTTAHANDDAQIPDTTQAEDATQADDTTNTEDTNQVEDTTLANNTMGGGSGIEKKQHRFSDTLLRFFQGFDDDIERGRGMRYPVSGIPHRTPMPALQFVLAGIVGKPATFYEVPIVRFAFGIISHTAMLGLFCFSFFLKNEDEIKPNEIFFYIFIFGLLWRELMEIRELLPPRELTSVDTTHPCIKFECRGVLRVSFQRRRALPPNRVASALRRYLFYDSWNILDASTIVCALIALVFRLAARFPDGLTSVLSSLHLSYPSNIRKTAFFVAQFFLVVSAPLLFARLLFLSQVDQTLGPMSQIIWTMLSHLVRFSLFVMVIMFSFAIAFYVYFLGCYEGDDDDDNDIQEAYGTLERSMLSLFNAMLGEFDFDVFLNANSTCERPSWANAASACLLVLYLVIMAILLLNLLIAVLSTAHAEVDRNAKEEFHLARSRAIQQNWKIVLEDRLPSPMNLVKPILGTVVDFFYDLRWVPKRIWFSCESSINANKDNQQEKYRPYSKEYWWKTATLGFLHRLIFACSMGLVALAASVLLWVISTPWMAWRYFRWCFQRHPGSAWYHEGYFSSLVNILLKSTCWLGFVVLAIIICAFSILGLIVLWLRGVQQVFEWLEKQWEIARKDDKKHTRPPERDWADAWEVAISLNRGSTFNVRRLLRLTTGSTMKEVSKISKRAEALGDEDHEKSHYADIARSLEKLTRSGENTERGKAARQPIETKDEGTQAHTTNEPASADAT